MSQVKNIRLLFDDIEADAIIYNPALQFDEVINYKPVGRKTVDTFLNKTILDPSNKVSASVVNGVTISGVPTPGNLLTATSATTATWLPTPPSTSVVVNVAGVDVQDMYVLYSEVDVYVMNATSFANVILPTAVSGKQIVVISASTSVGRLLISDVAYSFNLLANEGVILRADGTRWYACGRYSGIHNVTMGEGAMVDSGIDNVVLKTKGSGGSGSGAGVDTSRSVIVGTGTTGESITVDEVIAIGDGAASLGGPGTGSVAVGVSSGKNKLGDLAVAIGHSALENIDDVAATNYSIAIGKNAAQRNGVSVIAIGDSAMLNGGDPGSIAIGKDACSGLAPLGDSISIGRSANNGSVAGSQSVTIGYVSSNESNGGVVIGPSNVAGLVDNAIVCGSNNRADSTRDILIGSGITTGVGGGESVIIQSNGSAATIYPPNTVCVGVGNLLTLAQSVLYGTSNITEGGVLVGVSNNSTGSNVVFGSTNNVGVGGIASDCVMIGATNSLNTTTTTSNNMMMGLVNTMTVGSGVDNICVGTSNTVSGVSGTTIMGRANIVNAGNASTICIGNSNTVAASTTNGVVCGVGCSVNNFGVATNGIVAMGFNCTASQSGGGAVAVGAGCTATGDHSAAFGVGSRAVGSTFNVGVAQSVRGSGGVIAADYHKRYAAPLTSYTTPDITTTGSVTTTIVSGLAFTPHSMVVFNNNTGSGDIRFSLEDGLGGIYMASTTYTLSGYGYTNIPLSFTNALSMRFSARVLIRVTTFTVTTAPFAPRVTVLGMLYQIP